MSNEELTETEIREELLGQLRNRELTEELENHIDSAISVEIDDKINFPRRYGLNPVMT